MSIFVDADACPVKDEIYRVARRHGERVFVVANASIFVPVDPLFEMVTVRTGFDSADDWIVDHAGPGDVVVTSDIPLAERSLLKGALVLGPKGNPFTEETIGDALATRALLDMLRQSGQMGGGPAPLAKADRSRFLGKLDEMLHRARRLRPRPAVPPGDPPQ